MKKDKNESIKCPVYFLGFVSVDNCLERLGLFGRKLGAPSNCGSADAGTLKFFGLDGSISF